MRVARTSSSAISTMMATLVTSRLKSRIAGVDEGFGAAVVAGPVALRALC